jgi:hypothetical protein
VTEKKPRAWNSTMPQRTSWMKSTPKPLRGVKGEDLVPGEGYGLHPNPPQVNVALGAAPNPRADTQSCPGEG